MNSYSQIIYGIYHIELQVYLDSDGYHYPIDCYETFGFDTMQDAVDELYLLVDNYGFSKKMLRIHRLEKSIRMTQSFDLSIYD